MITALLIIHLLIILAMIGIILIQRNEGGALGIGGGANGLMTARGTANLLTRATAVLAVGFFVMTVLIAGVFKNSTTGRSIIDAEDELGILETTRPESSEEKHTTVPNPAQDKEQKKETPPSPSENAKSSH